ncbi:MAG: hypothetical protein L6R37_007826 [Teloschistes peruensis]|nr:MAG: hypothetical protein L6R37_007826 [Teloschistes peruensis]
MTEQAKTNGPVHLPTSKDLTADNITDNVIAFNSQGKDARLGYVLERLVTHVHDFARETRLSTKEWRYGLDFLEQIGKMCTEERAEFITLSDVLGLSALVDAIDHPKPPGATDGTILGPFHTHEAEEMQNGDELMRDGNGEPCLMLGTVNDTDGKPVADAEIHIWEANSEGKYDVQLPGRKGPDGRCVLHSDKNGSFWFKAIVPVPYPIAQDGPLGILFDAVGRHPYRPAHMHFMFEKPGFDKLITALYLRDDPYEGSDAVFGVKSSLIVSTEDIDVQTAKKFGQPAGSKVIRWTFVLASEEQASVLRNENSIKALKDLGRRVKLIDCLPVPDID